MMQWLGYNKELKRLVVETTANQVCEIFGLMHATRESETASSIFLFVYLTVGLYMDTITLIFGGFQVYAFLEI